MKIEIILFIIIVCCIVILSISEIKDNYRVYPRYYPRRFVTPFEIRRNYPQFVVTESCLNTCCDYNKCIEGKGCNWQTRDGEWVIGTPLQCLKYKDCIQKNDKDKNCLVESGVV